MIEKHGYESIVVKQADNKNGVYQDEEKEDFVTPRLTEGENLVPYVCPFFCLSYYLQ